MSRATVAASLVVDDDESKSPESNDHECSLCIVGSGYSGMATLVAAYDYLPKGSRVIVLDKRAAWGGQWVDQYSFVKLHQPHRHFTAGNFAWRTHRMPRKNLASKAQVLDHFEDVAARVSKKLDVTYLWEHEYLGYEEISPAAAAGKTSANVVVKLANLRAPEGPEGSAPAPEVRVGAAKCVRASGFNVQIKQPLPLTSTSVVSVGIADPLLSSEGIRQQPTTVYVVGSGKSACDAVCHLARINKDGAQLKIVMLTGRGSYFLIREKIFGPRWIGGVMITDLMHELTKNWDGENQRAVLADLKRKGILCSPVPDPENFSFGVLSHEELATVESNVAEYVKGRLVDVIDDADGNPEIHMKSDTNQRIPVDKGSIIVNCTEHLKTPINEPILSPNRHVMFPQCCLIFPGPTAFYMTHLFYLGRLRALAQRLHFVRWGDEPKDKLCIRSALVFLANLQTILFHVPPVVLLKDRSNFNTWYPLPRQGAAMVRMLWRRRGHFSMAKRLALEMHGAPDAAAAATMVYPATGQPKAQKDSHRLVVAASGTSVE